MGRMYSAVFENVGVTAAQDIIQIAAPATLYVIVHSIYLSQSSDSGDSESEMLNLLIHRGTSNGSGGSVPTARPLNTSDTAASTVVEVNNTSQGTEGVHLHASCFNVLSGLELIFTPQTRLILPKSGLLHVEIQGAPGDSLTMNGTVYFEEVRRLPRPYDQMR